MIAVGKIEIVAYNLAFRDLRQRGNIFPDNLGH
jgi:hypothetical protein